MMPTWNIILTFVSLQSCFCGAKKKIFIGGLVPSYSADKYGYEAALDLATEMINNRSDILKDYQIILRYGDTFGLESYTTRRVFEFMQWPVNESMRMMIGPAWSKNTGLSALACGSWKVVQLSYAASSVELQNNWKYPFLFTNVPATSSFNRARLSMIRRFGWKRVAVLQEYDDKVYSSAVEDLRNRIIQEHVDLTLITVEGFSLFTEGHPRTQLEKLQKLDARIIIGEFSPTGATKVFCEAYRMGMVSPKYVWVLSASLSGGWIFKPKSFEQDYKMATCNVNLTAKAAENFLIIDKIFIREDHNKTISGLTALDFMREVKRRNRRAHTFTSYAFDAMWTVALTLNGTLSLDVSYHPENVALENHRASVAYATLLSQTEFEGLSGPHRFTRRERLGTVRISQMRIMEGKARQVEVGRHDTFENKLIIYEDQANKLWKDGKIPADETTKEERVLTYSLLQLIMIGIFSALGVIYSVLFLYFNVSKRNHKVVRLSSPMINNVILLGCLLCYIFVLLLGIDSRFVDDSALGVLCNVRLYVLAIAFSLSFGALFSKTWRVHKIFTAQRAIKKKMMRDFHLILLVVFLVVIDVVLITVWVYVDPLQPEDIIFDEQKENSGDLIIIPILKICDSKHGMKFFVALYAYKGILLLFGVFLAWETRNVTIPALNDSKYIGMSVYNVVILSALGVTVSTILQKTAYFELLHVLISLVVFLSTTVTLTMIFLPKAHAYYFAKREPQQRTRTFDTLKVHSTDSTTTEMDDVYEAYVKRDLKDKWIQTEAPDNEPTGFLKEHEELPRPEVNCGVYMGNRELLRTMANGGRNGDPAETVMTGESIDDNAGSPRSLLTNGHDKEKEPLGTEVNSRINEDTEELPESVADSGLDEDNEEPAKTLANTQDNQELLGTEVVSECHEDNEEHPNSMVNNTFCQESEWF